MLYLFSYFSLFHLYARCLFLFNRTQVVKCWHSIFKIPSRSPFCLPYYPRWNYMLAYHINLLGYLLFIITVPVRNMKVETFHQWQTIKLNYSVPNFLNGIGLQFAILLYFFILTCLNLSYCLHMKKVLSTHFVAFKKRERLHSLSLVSLSVFPLDIPFYR